MALCCPNFQRRFLSKESGNFGYQLMQRGDICVKYSLGQKTVCCFDQEVNDLYVFCNAFSWLTICFFIELFSLSTLNLGIDCISFTICIFTTMMMHRSFGGWWRGWRIVYRWLYMHTSLWSFFRSFNFYRAFDSKEDGKKKKQI